MAKKGLKLVVLAFSLCYFFCVVPLCYSNNNVHTIIKQGVAFRDWDRLNSPNNAFTLRFFSLGTNTDRYLGIFSNFDDGSYYYPSSVLYEFPSKKEKAVWVANRDNPIPDASGFLLLNNNSLIISHSGGTIISLGLDYVVGSTVNTSVRLLDSGNLVVQEEDGSSKRGVLWQSFDYPTDTLLNGMKLGMDLMLFRSFISNLFCHKSIFDFCFERTE